MQKHHASAHLNLIGIYKYIVTHCEGDPSMKIHWDIASLACTGAFYKKSSEWHLFKLTYIKRSSFMFIAKYTINL